MSEIGMRNDSPYLSILLILKAAPALFGGCGPMTQLNQLADCHPESAWSNLTMSFFKGENA